MRYKIEQYNEDLILDDIDSVLERCIEEDYHEDDDYFQEWVNNTENSVCINGCTYEPYDILDALDDDNLDDLRRAYCEMSNDDDEQSARYDLRNAEPGSEVYIQRWTVHVLPDEDDPEETGDYDGDDIFALKARLEQTEAARKEEQAEEEKNERDLLQIIGG